MKRTGALVVHMLMLPTAATAVGQHRAFMDAGTSYLLHSTTAVASSSHGTFHDTGSEILASMGFVHSLATGPVLEATRSLQRIGENAFAAALVISALQAAVALYQYRSNPRGELIVPPGLTWGVETPFNQTANTPILSASSRDTEEGRSRSVSETTGDDDSTYKYIWSRPLSRLNQWLFLLLPLVSGKLSFIMERNIHLFHISFVMSLATVFGLQRPRLRGFGGDEKEAAHWKLEDNTTQKVLVIGDSLAVGLGCSNQYDTNKNQSTPMMRLEVLTTRDKDGGDDATGPVFPRVLARTLSQKLQSKVMWRSAGVDGGSVEDIQHFCLSVVEEEAAKGHSPDFVVLLCGMNDLKAFVGNPFHASSAVAFQQKLADFIDDIRVHAPSCKVILPALPIQMFHRKSIFNIFPLGLFLDAVVGFWDSQKKRVADKLPSHVLYVGLSGADIFSWYKKQDGEGEHTTLIAADGVHPNKRCYSKWAEAVAAKLLDKLDLK